MVLNYRNRNKMYLIEIFIKWLNKNNRGRGANPHNIFKNEDLNNVDSTDENCIHNFFPIDSSGEILSCSKCGILIKKNDANK